MVLSSQTISKIAGSQPDFLTERRLKALNHFLAAPMPGRRDEIWRRVEFGQFDLDASAVPSDSHGAMSLSGSLNGATAKGAYWSNAASAGREVPELLNQYWNTQVFPAGIENKFHEGGKFHSLNQALWNSGYVLYVPRDKKIEIPLSATFDMSKLSGSLLPHSLIVLEEGAEATVIESYLSSTASGDPNTKPRLCCPQTEIVLKPGAKLRYVLQQNTSSDIVYIGAHRSNQYASSSLDFASAHLGSRWSKTFMAAKMLEPKAHAYLYGLYYGTGTQKIHMDTFQHHVAPDCTTDLMFKGALTNSARAVYRGMIHLDAGAQKTDAYQQNRTLLLSKDARIDSIPGLEILANDVRCTHGSTAGQIDPTILFYLMSRGLTEFQAKKMIMDGFFEEVILHFGLESVIEPLRKQIDEKIGEER